MARKRSGKRRVDRKGRSVGGDAHHARFYQWEIKSAAYRSLKAHARALLLELKALYNGSNNGELYMSVREAAKRVGCGKNLASEMPDQLQDRGFIRPNEVGAFNLKAAAGGGKATSWILTEYAFGNATAGTKDFMHWKADAPLSKSFGGPSLGDTRYPTEGQPTSNPA